MTSAKGYLIYGPIDVKQSAMEIHKRSGGSYVRYRLKG